MENILDRLKVYISANEIKSKVIELGKTITEEYQGSEITVVGVLKGSVIFLADLIREIKLPLMMDFLEVSSYGKEYQSSGVVKIVKDLTHSIENQNVLIVEDIIDSGLTMDYLVANLRTRRPKDIKICSLLFKPSNLSVNLKVDYLGFTIENRFVIGYGLDYQGGYRNLEYIGYLEEAL